MRKIAFLLMLALISSFGCHNSSPVVNKKQDSPLSQIVDTKDQKKIDKNHLHRCKIIKIWK